MSVIQPDAEVGAALFPKIFAGQYGTDGLNVMAPTFLGYAPEGRALGLSLYILTCVIVVIAGGLVRIFFDSVHGLIALAIRDNSCASIIWVLRSERRSRSAMASPPSSAAWAA